jgi:hypothetical protein
MRIRITEVPPGEAPEEIRRAWIGIELPLAEGHDGPRSRLTHGVLSGPRPLLLVLLRWLFWSHTASYGYTVDADNAIFILGQTQPTAAAWWRENVPLAVQPGRTFQFAAEVCQEIVE